MSDKQAQQAVQLPTPPQPSAPGVPADPLAERIVLATLFVDPNVLPVARAWVHAPDFAVETNGAIFEGIVRVAQAGACVTVDAVAEDLERVHGSEWLAEHFAPFRDLVALLPLAVKPEVLVDYLSLVRGRSQLRQFVALLDESRLAAVEGWRSGDLVVELQDGLNRLMTIWRTAYGTVPGGDHAE